MPSTGGKSQGYAGDGESDSHKRAEGAQLGTAGMRIVSPNWPPDWSSRSNRPSETVRSSTDRRNISFGSDPHGSGAWRGDVGGAGGDGRKLERGGGASISPAREQIDGSFYANEARER